MAELTVQDAVAYLTAHPPQIPDRQIAERATQLVRAWNVIDPRRAGVSRPFVCAVRRGKLRRVKRRKSGAWKLRAVWQAMVDLKLVPALPKDALGAPTSQAPRRKRQRPYDAAGAQERNRVWYLKQRVAELEARLVNGHAATTEKEIEIPMLTPQMLRWFGLEKNPVYDEIASDRDLWWGSQHKEAKAVLIDAAENARFIRLAGRRGAGKSLVAQAAKKELEKREEIVIVEPSPTITGVLSETHLITSVIQAIKRRVDGRDELFPEAQSPAKRALAMRYLLIQQKRAQRKVVVWIDEAHELRAGTFLALKRFLDEVDGLGRRLLGVILVGQQPEASYNPRARDLSEVTLRMQTYRIGPMNAEIPDYLRFKIQRASGTVSDIIAPSALRALGERCPYPLDANAVFAQLLIDAYGDRVKPIKSDRVELVAPEEDEGASVAGGA